MITNDANKVQKNYSYTLIHYVLDFTKMVNTTSDCDNIVVVDIAADMAEMTVNSVGGFVVGNSSFDLVLTPDLS